MMSVMTVLEVIRLLNEDRLTQQEIADRLRVSRSSVSAIAVGRRRSYDREQAKKQARRRSVPKLEKLPLPGGNPALQPSPQQSPHAIPLRGRKPKPKPLRCPGCGGLVVPPCRLCETRAVESRGGVPRRVA